MDSLLKAFSSKMVLKFVPLVAKVNAEAFYISHVFNEVTSFTVIPRLAG